MKKYFVIFIFLLSNKCFSQQLTFQKYYVDSLDIFSDYFEVLQSNDRGYLMGNVRALVKMDSLGQIEWYKKYPYGLNTCAFYTGCKTNDSGYAVTGYSLLIKLSANYTINWKKELIGPFANGHSFYTIKETKDHGFILGGVVDLPTDHYCLVKTDSLGNVQWSKVYSSATGSDTFGSLVLTNDGGYLLCGTSDSAIDTTGFLFDNKVLKVDSLGSPQWAKHYNYNSPTGTSYGYHIIATTDGAYVLCGSKNFNKYLLKIDSTGTIVWEKTYYAPTYGSARWVEETKDHGLIVSGMHSGPLDPFLLKTDSAGNLLWVRSYPNLGPWGSCVKETDDGGFIMGAIGYAGTNSQGDSFSAMCLIKTDALGHTNGCYEDSIVMTVTNIMDTVVNVAVTDSNINVTTIPSILAPVDSGYEFVLCPPVVGVDEITKDNGEIKIYPNPFTEKFKISGLKFKVGEKLNMVIYDLMGGKVFEKEFLTNTKAEEINLSYLQQGVYFLNIKTKGESYTKKVVKM